MEIYKEDAYDLLVDRDNVRFPTFYRKQIRFEIVEQAPKLPIRENEAGQVFVANLSTRPLSSMKEFDRIYA